MRSFNIIVRFWLIRQNMLSRSRLFVSQRAHVCIPLVFFFRLDVRSESNRITSASRASHFKDLTHSVGNSNSSFAQEIKIKSVKWKWDANSHPLIVSSRGRKRDWSVGRCFEVSSCLWRVSVSQRLKRYTFHVRMKIRAGRCQEMTYKNTVVFNRNYGHVFSFLFTYFTDCSANVKLFLR